MCDYDVVIIGTGLAGYSLAREFRRLDKHSRIVLLTADDGRSYSKPMLSSALKQGKTADTLAMANAEKMQETLSTSIITNCTVEKIDTEAKQIFTNKDTYQYKNLVLAVGAQPIRLPIQGEGAKDILSVNNLTDYAVFRRHLSSAKHVAILGPGLIGCEFANDLLHADKQVTVIGPDHYPLSTLLPETVGTALQAALTAKGVTWHLNTVVESVDKTPKNYKLVLKNGVCIEADVVLSAVGLRPDIRLAEAANLTTNRGIMTDKFLQTSAKSVYALGDCAEVEGKNLPFVAPLMQGAKALAKTLTGDATAVDYPPMPVVVKTSFYPLVILPPAPFLVGQWVSDSHAEGIYARYENEEGQLVGFALSGAATADKQKYVKLMSH